MLEIIFYIGCTLTILCYALWGWLKFWWWLTDKLDDHLMRKLSHAIKKDSEQ